MYMRSIPVEAGTRETIVRNSPAVHAAAFAVVLLLVAAHLLSNALAGDRAYQVSLGFLILGPLLASAACLYRARRGRAKGGWLGLALAMLLWSGGMAANMAGAVLQQDMSGVADLTMFLFVLYGAPIIFVLASPDRERWHVRLVDGALVLTLGYLFFVCTMTFTTMSGANQAGFLNLRLMFDIENLFIAVLAAIRFRASRKGAPRALFRTLAIYAWVYLASAFYINHYESESGYGSLVDPLINLPFLVLAALAFSQADGAARDPEPPRTLRRIIDAASPLILPVSLLAISAAMVRSYPVLAVAGFAVATLGYGLRNILVQVRGLEEREVLERLSMLDGLTGLPNRRQFDARLSMEWERARRNGAGMVLLMIDIDHFKLLNDSFGHPQGDQRLRDVARALAGCAGRGSDMVARYGGEEFAAILPSTDPSKAVERAEAMRLAVERLNLASPAPCGRVTVSIGAAYLVSAQDNSAEGLLAAADGALYQAKQGGRNRVMVRNAASA